MEVPIDVLEELPLDALFVVIKPLDSGLDVIDPVVGVATIGAVVGIGGCAAVLRLPVVIASVLRLPVES